MGQRQGELRTDTSGQFYRQIGRKVGLAGQPKFRLGSDLAKAQWAYSRLGALWGVLCAEAEAANKMRNVISPRPEVVAEWTDDTLAMANAIRQHQHSVQIGVPKNVRDPAAYVAYLDNLRQRFGHIIYIVAADVEAAEAGKADHLFFAEHRARQARLNARIAEVQVPEGLTGVTLYQAIDAYAARAVEQTTKESGKVEAANALRLKNSLGDLDLAEFGYTAMERLRNYWTARPIAKLRGGRTTGRRISLTTVDNHLATARRFVRWLDRSDAFKWEMPRHGTDALTANLKRLETDEETAGRRHGVKVFTVDQLTTIYAAATDFERLLLLLGLNAAMAQAEISSLRWDEIEGNPVTIRRVRRKSKVYGEFLLWNETMTALNWWKKVRPSFGPLVMTTATGRSYTRTEIANAWNKIPKRIARSSGQPVTWWLAFKHLRKTGAQLVRQAADGEVAGTFLSHGKPVATDGLSDRYSNRPFDRVGEALSRVREQLSPMIEAAPTAFTSSSLGSAGMRRKLAGRSVNASE